MLLAHPERCPAFQRDPARLERLVEAGVLVQVTAGSIAGGFGATVGASRAALLRDGWCTSSPPTPTTRSSARPGSATASPRSSASCRASASAPWMTEQVPRAILDGTPLPERPPLPKQAGFLRRLGLRA